MDQIIEYWPTIMQAWKDHGDKRPVIEFDLDNNVIKTWPADDYINGLGNRTKESARINLRRILDQGGIVIFVKDTRNRILLSHSLSASEITNLNNVDRLTIIPDQDS